MDGIPPCYDCAGALRFVPAEATGIFRLVCPVCASGKLAASPVEADWLTLHPGELPRTVPPIRYAVRWRSTAAFPVSSDGWLTRGWVENEKKRLVRRWSFTEGNVWEAESFPTLERAAVAFVEARQGGVYYFEAVPIPPRPARVRGKGERAAW